MENEAAGAEVGLPSFLKLSSFSVSNVSSHDCIFASQDKCDVIVDLRRITGMCSLIGCAVMLCTMVLFKTYRNFSHRMILYLTVAALLDCIPYSMTTPHVAEGGKCKALGFLNLYFDWTVVLWISCITFNGYYNLTKQRTSEAFQLYYQVLCWVGGLVPALIAYFTHSLGPAGLWCWVTGTAARFSLWYGPLVALILLISATHIALAVHVYRQTAQWKGTYRPEVEDEKYILKKLVAPLRFYPIFFLISMTPPLANRIQEAVDPSHPVFGLYVMQATISPLFGFLVCLIFGFTSGMIKACNSMDIQRAIHQHTHKAQIKTYDLNERLLGEDEQHNDESDDEENFLSNSLNNKDSYYYNSNNSNYSKSNQGSSSEGRSLMFNPSSPHSSLVSYNSINQ